MSVRKRIAITFVGDAVKDSRVFRFVSTLSKKYSVSVISLHDTKKEFGLAGGHVHQIARKSETSLPASLWHFWSLRASAVLGFEPDLYIASDLYSLPLTERSARRRGTPVWYDSRELYTSLASLKGKVVRQAVWSLLEKYHARSARIVTTVNDSIADILKARFPAARVEVLHNYPLSEIDPSPVDLRGMESIPDNATILLSQGGLQKGRGAETALAALKSLPESVLVFLGSGAMKEEIVAMAKTFGVEQRVRHIEAVPYTGLINYTAAADIGLCLVENLGKSYFLSLPNKLFEYIAAGLPVIGSTFPEISAVINRHGVGICVSPEHPEQVVEAVHRLRNERTFRERCIGNTRIAAEEFRWEHESGKLHDLLDSVLN